MSLFLPTTASNIPEWVRKAASAINGLLAGVSRVENIAAEPQNPEPGRIYFDTTSKKGRMWDGTAWHDLW